MRKLMLESGYEVKPVFGTYANNGNLALRLVCIDGEPYATVSCNTDKILRPDEIVVKDWSENEGIKEQLIEAGWLEAEPLGYMLLGYCDAPIHRVLITKES